MTNLVRPQAENESLHNTFDDLNSRRFKGKLPDERSPSRTSSRPRSPPREPNWWMMRETAVVGHQNAGIFELELVRTSTSSSSSSLSSASDEESQRIALQ